LDLVAAEVAQAAQLPLRLDALGDDPQRQAVAEVDDRLHDDLVVRAVLEVLHERLVDLQPLDRQALDVGERGVAGAEVVDREGHAELVQVAQALRRGLAVLDDRVLGELDVERGRIEAALAQHALDQELDPALAELHRREVDRHLHVAQPLVAPDPVLAAGCAQHPGRQRRDEADVLGQPDELARPHQPALGMVPADQRLDPDQPVRGEVELRLVVDDELLGGERLAQLALERHGRGAPGGSSPAAKKR
jgi:hypothetical protein